MDIVSMMMMILCSVWLLLGIGRERESVDLLSLLLLPIKNKVFFGYIPLS